jgi:hypothetical protein
MTTVSLSVACGHCRSVIAPNNKQPSVISRNVATRRSTIYLTSQVSFSKRKTEMVIEDNYV